MSFDGDPAKLAKLTADNEAAGIKREPGFDKDGHLTFKGDAQIYATQAEADAALSPEPVAAIVEWQDEG